MVRIARLFPLLSLLMAASVGQAADYQVPARPGAVEDLLKSGRVSGGDRLILAPGKHGTVILATEIYDPPLTLTAAPGDKAVLHNLIIDKIDGLVVSNLVIQPTPGQEIRTRGLVQVKMARNLVLDRLTVSSAPSAQGWSAATWRERAHHGITVRAGQDIAITNNRVSIVKHGIVSRARRSRVEGNTIEYFAGDGLRGLADDSVFVRNSVSTCVKIDDNHDDGFQSWSGDADHRPGSGVISNVRVEYNLFQNGNVTGPLACEMQGIGLFDGFYKDWVIRGNVILSGAWHGIAVYGADGVTVQDNIVVDADNTKPGPPWITVVRHKDGRLSRNSTITGNVSQREIRLKNRKDDPPQPGVRASGNIVVRTPEQGLAYRR